MPPRPDDAVLIQAFGEGIEAARIESERKWGFGRVEHLAALENTDLLARFRNQQRTWAQTYSQAWEAEYLTSDLLTLLQAKAGSMQRAFKALDAWATEAGHRPIQPWVWEANLQDGTIVALVEDDAAASHVIAEGRQIAVYTAREIANLIDAIPDALKLAKTVWTGAKFKAPEIERSNGEWVENGDPIPFGDPDPDEESKRPFIPAPGPKAELVRQPSLAPKVEIAPGGLSPNWEDDL